MVDVQPITLRIETDAAGFLHPAAMVGPREIALMRHRLRSGEEPWRTAIGRLSASAPLDVKTHEMQVLHIDYNGKGAGHKEFVENDAVQCYSQTMMWLCTGTERYAQNAARILHAWATTNRQFTGQNAPLEAGWGVCSMLRAMELLRYTWQGFTPELWHAFMAWVDRHVMTDACIYQKGYQNWNFKGNWHSTVAEMKAQLAAMRGDRRLWGEALQLAKETMEFYLFPTGECWETKRDLYHSQFGLGSLVQVCELAWQQGQELYSYRNNALYHCLEFHAAICNGAQPQCCTYELKGVGFQPIWEIPYNHYHGRLGLPMPETEKLLAKYRPEKYIFQWGLGTLSHCGSADILYRNPKGSPGRPPSQQEQHELPMVAPGTPTPS